MSIDHTGMTLQDRTSATEASIVCRNDELQLVSKHLTAEAFSRANAGSNFLCILNTVDNLEMQRLKNRLAVKACLSHVPEASAEVSEL